MAGKSIHVFLVDGVPTGLRTAEIDNWTGKLLVCPRSALTRLVKREEVAGTGVYFLIGVDGDRVYIGESDEVARRLRDHERDESKAFYETAIVAVSKDDNLTKSHVLYLENALTRLVEAAGEAVLATAKTRSDPKLPEADRAFMEGFLEQVRLVMPVLGHTFLEPATSTVRPDPTPGGERTEVGVSPEFLLAGKSADARSRHVDDQVVVQRGSRARVEESDSLQQNWRSLRSRLQTQGTLVPDPDDPDVLVFAEDCPFSSPTAAACAVLGYTMSGRTAWKTSDGTTYGDWFSEQVAAAEAEAGPTDGDATDRASDGRDG